MFPVISTAALSPCCSWRIPRGVAWCSCTPPAESSVIERGKVRLFSTRFSSSKARSPVRSLLAPFVASLFLVARAGALWDPFGKRNCGLGRWFSHSLLNTRTGLSDCSTGPLSRQAGQWNGRKPSMYDIAGSANWFNKTAPRHTGEPRHGRNVDCAAVDCDGEMWDLGGVFDLAAMKVSQQTINKLQKKPSRMVEDRSRAHRRETLKEVQYMIDSFILYKVSSIPLIYL